MRSSRRPTSSSTPWRLALVAIALVAAGHGAAEAQTSRWDQWPKSRPPRPLAAREVPFPPYEVRTLPNGLRVVVVPHHEQPSVTIRLLVGAGAAQDPAGKAGLATLVAALLDQGTTSRSAEQIADTIDFIGGAVGTGAGTDLSFVNIVVMRDSFDLGLELASDLARHPTFRPEEIGRQLQQITSSLKVSYQDPGYLASTIMDRLVYGFHPYGVPSAGTPESVASLTRDDLVTFHREWFKANNALIAIVGDVKGDEAFAAVSKVFGDWARGDLPAQRFTDPPQPTRRVVVVDRPGAVQTEIRAGNVAIPRKHPDYMALDLTVKVLGGEGANRLQQVLRSQRSLTYGAQADLEALRRTGSVVGETNTRSEATGEALRVVVDEFSRIQREPVNERELDGARDYLTGNFPLTIETPDAIALQVLNALFYDLDLKELATFRERVDAVSVEDVQRVARGYLHPSRLSIVLVGDASVITPQLKGAGFGEFEVITPDELDLTAANFRRPR